MICGPPRLSANLRYNNLGWCLWYSHPIVCSMRLASPGPAGGSTVPEPDLLGFKESGRANRGAPEIVSQPASQPTNHFRVECSCPEHGVCE